MAERIGFIGLGVMGEPMARHALTHCDALTVFDVDAAKTQRLVAEGANAASSVAEVGKASDVVILSLPGSPIVRQVVLATDGLAPVMRQGTTIIDTSTTEPAVSVEIATTLKALGIGFLDAPVSGGEKAATEGTLSFMVGGPQAVFNACRPILESMGTTVVRVGESGQGEAAKMINQMIVGATFAVIAEGFALAVKSGLDPGVLYSAIRNGWAGSKLLDLAVNDMLGRGFKPGGSVNIHTKDLGYALSLAKDKDVPTPVTALVHEIFKAAKAAGKGGLSQPAIVMLWEKLLGVEIKGNTRELKSL